MKVTSYRDLRVWQLGMDLAEASYRLTREFPRDELFGLTSQIRRAAGSVPANIAEEYGRNSTRDYLRFLRVAQGNLKELETHLLLACRVGVLETKGLDPILAESARLGRMLLTLHRSVSRAPGKASAALGEDCGL